MNIDIYKNIDNAVFKGIKKTINRFRENPFYYFTEADIHSALHNDIIEGHSKLFYKQLEKCNYRVSLVHQEYPTSFRYKKNELGTNFYEGKIDLTDPSGKYGDRGNYDLVVIDPDFTKLSYMKIKATLRDIINKDIKTQSHERVKPLFFIEVKFLHVFNYKHKNMIAEVKKDNEKLALALHYTDNAKAINLVFCSAENSVASSVISQIKDYILNSEDTANRNVVTVFVQSFLDEENVKSTPKPFCNCNAPEWARLLL